MSKRSVEKISCNSLCLAGVPGRKTGKLMAVGETFGLRVDAKRLLRGSGGLPAGLLSGVADSGTSVVTRGVNVSKLFRVEWRVLIEC